jgi:hypothetical protein
MSVNPVATPSINISGVTTVTQGSSVAVTSTVINGGTTPVYQWQDSSSQHTWQNIVGATQQNISFVPLSTGTGLRCILSSNASCLTVPSAISNVLRFTVTPTAIVVVNPTSVGIRYYPNPTERVLTIDGIRNTDRWETVEIRTVDGRLLSTEKIAGRTRIDLNVKSLSNGIYSAILRGTYGQVAYLLFLKQ